MFLGEIQFPSVSSMVVKQESNIYQVPNLLAESLFLGPKDCTSVISYLLWCVYINKQSLCSGVISTIDIRRHPLPLQFVPRHLLFLVRK